MGTHLFRGADDAFGRAIAFPNIDHQLWVGKGIVYAHNGFDRWAGAFERVAQLWSVVMDRKHLNHYLDDVGVASIWSADISRGDRMAHGACSHVSARRWRICCIALVRPDRRDESHDDPADPATVLVPLSHTHTHNGRTKSPQSSIKCKCVISKVYHFVGIYCDRTTRAMSSHCRDSDWMRLVGASCTWNRARCAAAPLNEHV